MLARILLLFASMLPITALGAQTTSAPSSELGLRRLQNELGRLAELSGGKVGVTAIRLETGGRFS
jgi:hypothetical protein